MKSLTLRTPHVHASGADNFVYKMSGFPKCKEYSNVKYLRTCRSTCRLPSQNISLSSCQTSKLYDNHVSTNDKDQRNGVCSERKQIHRRSSTKRHFTTYGILPLVESPVPDRVCKFQFEGEVSKMCGVYFRTCAYVKCK